MGNVVDRRAICNWTLIPWSSWCGLVKSHPYVCAMQYKISVPERILNWNLAQLFRFLITHCLVVKSFWDFAQIRVVSLPCNVHVFEKIWQLKWIFWTNEISRDWHEFRMHIFFSDSPLWPLLLAQINCSRTHLKLKSRTIISLPHHSLFSSEIVLRFCSDQSSITAVQCACFRKDLTTEMDILDEWDFSRLAWVSNAYFF